LASASLPAAVRDPEICRSAEICPSPTRRPSSFSSRQSSRSWPPDARSAQPAPLNDVPSSGSAAAADASVAAPDRGLSYKASGSAGPRAEDISAPLQFWGVVEVGVSAHVGPLPSGERLGPAACGACILAAARRRTRCLMAAPCNSQKGTSLRGHLHARLRWALAASCTRAHTRRLALTFRPRTATPDAPAAGPLVRSDPNATPLPPAGATSTAPARAARRSPAAGGHDSPTTRNRDTRRAVKDCRPCVHREVEGSDGRQSDVTRTAT
jgi:hypothetical protein